MKNPQGEFVVGDYVSGHSVKGFLGETWFSKIVSYVRYTFRATENTKESSWLKLNEKKLNEEFVKNSGFFRLPSLRFGNKCVNLL